MAYRESMNWDESFKCWHTMLNGRRYKLTRRKATKDGYPISAPWTKDDSRQFANEWISKQKPEPKKYAHQETLDQLAERAAIARDLGMRDEGKAIEEQAKAVKKLAPDEAWIEPEAAERIKLAAMLQGFELTNLDPTLVNLLYGRQDVYTDRKKRAKAVELDKTAKAVAEKYLASRKAEIAVGQLEIGSYDQIQNAVKAFLNFFGESTAISAYDADCHKAWWLHVAGNADWGKWTKPRMYRLAKAFLQDCADHELLDLPKNFASKKLKFGKPEAAITTFTANEVKALIDLAQGQLKAHLLLMANCGFTQVDISDLRHDEVDLDKGTITRKRSKTKNEKGVPTVEYKLWQSTIDELRKFQSTDKERFFTKDDGQPLLVEKFSDKGGLSKNDWIAKQFAKLDSAKTLKIFRKTSSTLIADTEWSDCTQLFLGHSPQRLDQKHYTLPAIKRLTAAITWLGKQYGIK